MKIRTLVTLLLLGAVGNPLMTLAQNMPGLQFEEGDVFPDIQLPSLEDGSPVSLADLKGRKLVLHIFASW